MHNFDPRLFPATSNFFCQLQGRKHVLLFPPSQSWRLYPHVHRHPMTNFAIADLENPDIDRLPALRDARGLEATLEPGDVLFLPAYYWHYVRQAGDGLNLSVNFWVGGRPESCKRCGLYEQREQASNRALPSMDKVRRSAAACKARTEATLRKRAHGAAAGSTDSGEDEAALLEVDGDGGLLSLFTSFKTEVIPATVLGVERGAALLHAMAMGADAGAVGATKGAWPFDTDEAVKMAALLRQQILALLHTEERVHALLRAMTRHGRLRGNGLAPPVRGPVINSEASEATPIDEVRRLMAVEREGEWGNSPICGL